MKLAEARPILRSIENIRFKDLYTPDQLINIIIAKGDTGKLLEKLLGLPPGNTLKDFEDGELKSNKVDKHGKPRETMFITQISRKIDELLSLKDFEGSWIREKIRRLIYVPVVKDDPNPREWYFLQHVYVEINYGEPLYEQLKVDYELICEKMRRDVMQNDGNIHTSSGRYIQIRSKDAIPYNPIYSMVFQKYISNKNHAFYFKKDFMLDIWKYAK